MDHVKKLPTFTLLLAMLLLVVGVLAMPEAEAQGAGRHEAVKTFSAALSGGTAMINSSTSKKIVVHSMIVRASAAGVLTISDGTGGTALAKVYLPQDTNVELTSDLLGEEGLRTTAGNALDASMSTNTITAVMRIHYE
jgi:hypothetical protein